MQHESGTRAHTSTHLRMSVLPPSKAQVVATAHGSGARMPDGSVVGIDSAGKPFRVNLSGVRHPLPFGVHSFGEGIKVRIFEATVVRVVTPDGQVTRFDSRGNVRVAPRPGEARGGPSGVGGGVTQIGQSPALTGGGPAAGSPAGGAPSGGATTERIAQLATLITELRQMLHAYAGGDALPGASLQQGLAVPSAAADALAASSQLSAP